MQLFRILDVFFLILFAPLLASGQTGNNNNEYFFKTLGKEAGFPTKGSSIVIQDTSGLIYASLGNKLFRYHGTGFEPLKSGNDSLDNIYFEKGITSFAIDKKNQLWFGTGGGFGCYNKEYDTIKFYLHDPTDKYSYYNNMALAIDIDEDDQVWVSHWYGISCLNQETGKFKNYDFYLLTGTPTGGFQTLEIDTVNDQVWAGDWRGNIFVLDMATEQIKVYKNSDHEKKYGKRGKIKNIYADPFGNIWVGTFLDGLHLFNPEDEAFKRFTPETMPGFLSVRVHDIVYNKSKQEYWIGTEEGVNIIDFEQGIIKRLVHDPADKNSIQENNTQAIYIDRAGGVWLSPFKLGLSYYHEGMMKFRQYTKSNACNAVFKSHDIWSFFEEPKDHIWFNTREGPAIFDQDNNRFIKAGDIGYEYLEGERIFEAKHYLDSLIFFVLFDRIIEVNKQTGKMIEIPWPEDLRVYLSHPDDMQLMANNKFIIPRSLIGYVIFDPVEKTLTKLNLDYLTESAFNKSISFNKNRTTGYIYNGNELYKYDVLEDTVLVIKEGEDENCNTRGENDLIFTSSRDIFIFGDGFMKYEKDKCFTSMYGKKNGINTTIHEVMEVQPGVFWFFTSEGISKFELEKEMAVNYNSLSEGLLTLNYSNVQNFKDSDGELFFSGGKGVNSFFPSEISLNKRVPSIELSSFDIKLDGQVQTGVLEKNINYSEKIRLKHHQNSFSFTIAVYNYLIPEKNQFTYYLEGYDEGWVTNAYPQNTGEYMNLPPGKYVLHYGGANNDGVWNKSGKLHIQIIPPFYRQIWFIVSVIVFLLSLGYLFFKRREIAAKNVKRKLEMEINKAVGTVEAQKKELQSTFDELVAREEKEKVNKWHAEGLAKFGKIMSKEKESVSKLTKLVVQELVNYLDALQAVFYVISADNEDQHLQLKGHYAFSSRKKPPKRVEVYEGGVAECYRTAKVLNMEVPESFVKYRGEKDERITNYLTLVPLKFEELVLGTIEIGSDNLIDEHKIQFLMEFAERYTSIINSIRMNNLGIAMIEHAKNRAKEMKDKEIELRKKLEEVSMAQEDMQKLREQEDENLKVRLKKLEEQREALVEILDFFDENIYLKDKSGRVLIANKNKAKAHGLTRDSIIGKSDSELYNISEAREFAKEDREVLEHGSKTIRETKAVGGKIVYTETYKQPIALNYLNKKGIICVEKEISDRVQVENQIKELEMKITKLKNG